MRYARISTRNLDLRPGLRFRVWGLPEACTCRFAFFAGCSGVLGKDYSPDLSRFWCPGKGLGTGPPDLEMQEVGFKRSQVPFLGSGV